MDVSSYLTPNNKPSEHDAAIRQYRDAVDGQAREERDKILDEEVAYFVSIDKAYHAAIKDRELKRIQYLRHLKDLRKKQR